MNSDPKNQSLQNNPTTQPEGNVSSQNKPQDPQGQPVVSIPVGGAEGAPARVETSAQNIESYLKPSDAEPKVSDEVAEVGVQTVPTRPQLHPEAESAGLKESIPSTPAFNYANLPADKNLAMQSYKAGDPGVSNTWRALIALKEFAKGILIPKKTQEVN